MKLVGVLIRNGNRRRKSSLLGGTSNPLIKKFRDRHNTVYAIEFPQCNNILCLSYTRFNNIENEVLWLDNRYVLEIMGYLRTKYTDIK